MPIPLPIETDRLAIRPFAPESDAEAMARVYLDPEVMRYIPGGVLADGGAVRRQLEWYAKEHAELGFSSWAVVERATGLVIGDAGFGIFKPTGDVELGWTLARDLWGHGFATEAAGACLAAGLEHLDVARIVAVVDVENERSLRVAKRLGMRRAEELLVGGRPHILFQARP